MSKTKFEKMTDKFPMFNKQKLFRIYKERALQENISDAEFLFYENKMKDIIIAQDKEMRFEFSVLIGSLTLFELYLLYGYIKQQ